VKSTRCEVVHYAVFSSLNILISYNILSVWLFNGD